MHHGAELRWCGSRRRSLRAVYVMSSRKLGIAAVVDARRRT